MNSLGNLFDKETVQSIETLIESKLDILQNVNEFKQLDSNLMSSIEELEDALSEDLNEKLDSVMRLNYNTNSYYLTLAYFLGMQHKSQIENL